MSDPKPGKGISLAALSASKAGDTPFEYEYEQDGVLTGIFVSVLGGQCTTVQTAINAAVNERRKKDAHNESIKARGGKAGSDFTPVEDDIEFAKRLAAIRICSWRGPKDTEGLTEEQLRRFQGIEEPCTFENALVVCKGNQDFADQALAASNNVSNFMKVSSPAS